MTENDRRQMNASEIPAFVVDVIEAGCNICAVGHESYVLGDIDEQHAAIEELERIREKYGDRDPLKLEIQCLTGSGRERFTFAQMETRERVQRTHCGAARSMQKEDILEICRDAANMTRQRL